MRFYQKFFEVAGGEFCELEDYPNPGLEEVTQSGAELELTFTSFNLCMQAIFELDKICQDYPLDYHTYLGDSISDLFDVYWIHFKTGLSLPIHGKQISPKRARALYEAQLHLNWHTTKANEISEKLIDKHQSKIALVLCSNSDSMEIRGIKCYSKLVIQWDVDLSA